MIRWLSSPFNRLILTLAVGLIVFPVLLYLVYLTLPGSTILIHGQFPSPDGTWTATVSEVDGGATVSSNTSLHLSAAEHPDDPEQSELVLWLRGRHAIGVEWRDETRLVVRLPKGADAVHEGQPSNGVQVEFVRE
ncbi:MAG TPA: hypothetical protein VED40_01910 [Azospirillaceae bacterium]|nr:hypothetical protein [Azospirillaceae bacterium]